MASADMNATLDMAKVAKNIQATYHVRLKGTRRFSLRIKAMMWLLGLAAWVSPVNTHIKVEDN